MKFQEIIYRYRNHTATAEEKQLVEEELEKFEALNDLACEKMEREMPKGWSEAKYGEAEAVGDQEDQNRLAEGEAFAKAIQKELRRAFAKAGACIGVLLLAVVLFLQFGLSPLINSFCYDPTEALWLEEGSDDTADRLSVDISVYSELFLPLEKYDYAISFNEGYGRYSFQISKSVIPEGLDDSVIAGEISRNTLRVFTPDLIRRPAQNLMGFSSQWEKDMAMGGITPEEGRAQIAALDEGEYVKAYVTFSQDLSFQQCEALLSSCQIDNAWYGVRLPDGLMGYGFLNSCNGVIFGENPLNEEFPDLLISDVDSDSGSEETRETYYQQHFLSMIRYLSQQETFLEMLDVEEVGEMDDEQIEAYFEKNGFNLYGMAVSASKESLMELSRQGEVYGICLP